MAVLPVDGVTYSTIIAAGTAANDADFIDLQIDVTEDVSLNRNLAGIYSTNGSTWANSSGIPLNILSGLTSQTVISDLIFSVTTGGSECVTWSTIGTNGDVVLKDCTFLRTSGTTGSMVKVASALGATENFLMERCRLTADLNVLNGFENSATTTANTIQIKNCIFEDGTNASGIAIKNAQSSANTILEVDGCDINNWSKGGESGSNDQWEGVVFTNNTDDVNYFNNWGTADFVECAFEQQTDVGGFGTGCQFGITDAVYVNTTDYVPAGAGVLAGAWGSCPLSVDFNNNARTATSDQGAVQIQAGAGSSNPIMVRMAW